MTRQELTQIVQSFGLLSRNEIIEKPNRFPISLADFDLVVADLIGGDYPKLISGKSSNLMRTACQLTVFYKDGNITVKLL